MVTRDAAMHVLALLSAGTPVVKACRDLGICRSEWYLAVDREGLADMHARAREEYAEARVEEMQNIAETVEDVGRAKLLCDNIKWEAARVASKKYGDRTALDVSGDLSISNMSDDELNAKLADILAKTGTAGPT